MWKTMNILFQKFKIMAAVYSITNDRYCVDSTLS